MQDQQFDVPPTASGKPQTRAENSLVPANHGASEGVKAVVSYLLDQANHASMGVIVQRLITLEPLETTTALLDEARSGQWNRRSFAITVLQTLPIPVMEGLREALLDLDTGYREQAAKALFTIGIKAVPTLIKLLMDPLWKMRRDASWALGLIGDRAAAPALVHVLSDPDPTVVKEAVLALGEIHDPESMPFLRGALLHDNFRVAANAADVLAHTGEAGFITLLGCLDDPNPEFRYAAIDGLQRSKDQRAIAGIICAAKDPDPDIRFAAIRALGEIRTEDAVNQLFGSLSDRVVSPRFRQRISELAERLLKLLGYTPSDEEIDDIVAPLSGQSARDAVKRLKDTTTRPLPFDESDQAQLNEALTLLNQSEAGSRIIALRKLAEIESDQAVRAVINALIDTDAGVAGTASDVLRHMEARAIPFFRDTIHTCSISLRAAMISCLGGFKHPEAAIILEQCLTDERPIQLLNFSGTIRDLAVHTLVSMDSINAQDVLKRYRMRDFQSHAEQKHVDPDKLRQQSLERGEGMLSLPHGFAAFERMLDVLRNEQWDQYQHTARALRDQSAAMIKHNRAEVLTFLERFSSDENWMVRWVCTEALSLQNVKEAAPILARRLRDTHKGIRIAAIRGLIEVGESSTVKEIIPLIRDKQETIREVAVEAIGILNAEMGLVGLMEAATNDESEFVRFAAVKALGRVENRVVLPVLGRALKDPNPNVRWAAANILTFMPDVSVTQALIEALEDHGQPAWEDKTVSDLAAAALRSLNTQESRRALEKWHQNKPRAR